MLKKIIFMISGMVLVVLTYGFVSSDSPELPVAADVAVRWEFNAPAAVMKISEGGPQELSWLTLTDVTFKEMYVSEMDMYYWKPTFGLSVKALENKEVYITGYVIPVDYDENFYVISRYPYANCYFCGGGGPESVVDLRFAGKNRTYKTDERLTFKGRLKLNATDVYQMNYILEGALEYTP
jgi:hypothetical protein